MIADRLVAVFGVIAVVSCAISVEASDRQANTLIAVNVTALRNDNRTVPGSLRTTFVEYRLYNEETKKTFEVVQRGRAKLIYLEPGVWCLHSTKRGEYEVLRVTNTGCFRVAENVINNAGTWVVGWRANRGTPNSMLVGMNENYLELESIFGVSDTQPAELSLPPQLIQERGPEDLSPLGT